MMLRAELNKTAAPPSANRFDRWHGRVLGFSLIVFALEIGMFLVIFPWTMWWGMSWIPAHSRTWNGFWMSRYFRGFITGLGLLNLYVALAEFVRQIQSLFGSPKS